MSHNQPHNIRRIFAVGQRFFSASSFRYPKGSRKDRRCGFRFRCPFSFTASRFVRVRQLAYGYVATTLSFSRSTAAPDWPTSSWAARAEQVVRRAGCHLLVVRENEREFVRNTKRAIGRYRRPRRRRLRSFRQAKWSFRQVLFKLCNWGARLSSCSTE